MKYKNNSKQNTLCIDGEIKLCNHQIIQDIEESIYLVIKAVRKLINYYFIEKA